MGIREKLNEKPAITTGFTIAILVIALAFIAYQIFGSDGAGSVQTEQYFTVDEGDNLFADEIAKVPPFQHEGKEAVRAYVFTCDEKKTQFVAYLERLTPAAKTKLEAAGKADPNSPPSPDIDMVSMEGTEVKKPKTGKWVKKMSPEGEKITVVTCPDGKGVLDIVMP